MKDDGYKKFVIMAIVILIFTTAIISNIAFGGNRASYTPKIIKSILNNSRNENTKRQNSPENRGVGEVSLRCSEELGEDLTCCYIENDGDSYEDISETVSRQKASSGVLIEASTGTVLKDENMNERCYPASTTKILTALVAIRLLPLDRVVTVDRRASGIEGSSIYLKAGQKITVEDLLYGMMLRSGNDAATALAIEACGSVEAFANIMNLTAKELGAKNSHFVNPHGLQDEEHYTTAYDLALITAAAYKCEAFRRIVSTKVRNITIDGEKVAIANKNKMLSLYEGANGVKTGYTTASGRCLVAAAKREGMQLISVTLNYPDMWNDSMRLLDYGFENFCLRPVEEMYLESSDMLTTLPETESWEPKFVLAKRAA